MRKRLSDRRRRTQVYPRKQSSDACGAPWFDSASTSGRNAGDWRVTVEDCPPANGFKRLPRIWADRGDG